MKPPARVSVTIPLFNEEEVFPRLLERLRQTLDGLDSGGHELIFVDDGSSDRTPELLDAAARSDPRITVLHLSRNFGHQAAITAGLDHASGDAVVVMDGDLQDPPERIPELLDKLAEGYDLVYARRVARKEGLLLRACYFFFYRLIAGLSATRLPLDAGDFAVLSRRVVDELKALPERQRYLRGLRSWVGFRQVGIEIERGPRGAGRPKYTLRKLFELAFGGLFSFSIVPLRLATLLGLAALLVSSAYAAYAVAAKLFLGSSPQGFTALIVALVFLAGVQLLMLGIVGEYIGRVYEEVKRRPNYIVRETVRHR